jgi:hypothetical protein
MAAFCSARNPQRDRSPLFEITRVLVRLDHVARFIENATAGNGRKILEEGQLLRRHFSQG